MSDSKIECHIHSHLEGDAYQVFPYETYVTHVPRRNDLVYIEEDSVFTAFKAVEVHWKYCKEGAWVEVWVE